MSKYKAIQTQITNKDHLCRALAALGVQYEVAQEGQDLALRDWLGRRADLTGAVVVRKKSRRGLFSDVGWSLDSATGVYLVQADEMDRKAQELINSVNQRCALLRLQELAGLNGFSLEVVEDEAGVQRVLLLEVGR